MSTDFLANKAVNGQIGRVFGMITKIDGNYGRLTVASKEDDGKLGMLTDTTMVSPLTPVTINPSNADLYCPTSYDAAFIPHSTEEVNKRLQEIKDRKGRSKKLDRELK